MNSKYSDDAEMFGNAVTTVPSLLQEILHLYPTLPPAERKVADEVISRPYEIVGLTATQLSEVARVSQPVTSRFCRRLSTRTLANFRVALAQELGRLDTDRAASSSSSDPSAGEPNPEMAAALAATQHDLEVSWRAVSTMDSGDLTAAVDAIVGARTVVCAGFDTSRAVAGRLVHLLRLEGLDARPEYDYHVRPSVQELRDGDVLILISYRGSLAAPYRAAVRTAVDRGATLIVVTNESRLRVGAEPAVRLRSHAPSQMTDEEYATGQGVQVQFAAARLLWRLVQRRTLSS